MMDELMESYMVIMAERDAAIRERNMALIEKKKMLTDKEKAMLQRDAAICERNCVMIERDKVISQLKYKSRISNGNNIPYGEQHHMNLLLDLAEAAYNPREVPFSDTFQNSTVDSATPKSKKVKRAKQTRTVLSKKVPKLSKNSKRGPKELNNQAKIIWKNEQEDSRGRFEWNEDSGLQLVSFDLTKLVVPVCSCTGKLQPCYKWGSGGWQSACCTTTISMFPLPHKENKPNARIGGRKMSGGVYTKLLHRLLHEGHDPSCPVDLKEHWARHGTNRYITIK